MLTTFFGDITNGRLQRLPFLGYLLLVILLFFGFVFAVIFAMGAGEKLIGGDLQQAQATLAQTLGIPFVIIFAVFMAVVLFVQANLMAKRIRDMGLPGWWVVLVLVIVSGVLGSMVSEQAGGGFHTLVYLILLLVPSNAFGKS
jgi:uncharacterized membrane protein YhaH (DUF805 family)